MTSSSNVSSGLSSMISPSSSSRFFLLGVNGGGGAGAAPFVFCRLADGSTSSTSSSGAERLVPVGGGVDGAVDSYRFAFYRADFAGASVHPDITWAAADDSYHYATGAPF